MVSATGEGSRGFHAPRRGAGRPRVTRHDTGTIFCYPPIVPSTHLSLHFHLVFSTKDRVPLIREEWRDRLHAYMGGIAHRLGAFPKAVGGVADHVHLLAGLPATLALADFMRDLKSFSSKWVREEIGEKKFVAGGIRSVHREPLALRDRLRIHRTPGRTSSEAYVPRRIPPAA